jgi:hypothetical protein
MKSNGKVMKKKKKKSQKKKEEGLEKKKWLMWCNEGGIEKMVDIT